MRIFLSTLFLVSVILLNPHKSYSAELLTNGSFETGNFTGWSTAMTQTSAWCTTWMVATSATGCINNAAPIDGTRSALNGFDGTGGEFRMWQDVAIPALVSVRLTFTRT